MGSDWILTTLGEHISIKHGFAFKGEFFKESPTYDCLITPGNFSIGGGFKGDKLKYYEGPVPDDYILKPNDLVVTMTDLSKEADTLGYSALIPPFDDKRLLHNQRIGLVHFKDEKVDKTFLYFLLRSRMYRHHVVSGATGTTVKHTSPSKILSYEFRLPSKSTQLKIGQKLYDLEKKITLNRQINQTLEKMAQTLFKSWFVDFDPVIDNALDAGNVIPDELKARAEQRQALRNAATQQSDASVTPTGNAKPLPDNIRQLFPNKFEESELGWVPKGWAVKTCEEIAERIGMGPFGSNIKTSTFVSSGVPVINGQQLKGFLVEETFANFLTPEHAEKLSNSIVKPGDIVFTHRGTIGQVSLIPSQSSFDKYIVSQSQFFLRPNVEILGSYYIECFFKSALGQQRLLSNASQVGVPAIARPSSHLKQLKILVPSYDTQAYFETLVGTYIESIVLRNKELKTLTKLRDTLLPKLISGELRLDEVESTIEEAMTA